MYGGSLKKMKLGLSVSLICEPFSDFIIKCGTSLPKTGVQNRGHSELLLIKRPGNLPNNVYQFRKSRNLETPN